MWFLLFTNSVVVLFVDGRNNKKKYGLEKKHPHRCMRMGMINMQYVSKKKKAS